MAGFAAIARRHRLAEEAADRRVGRLMAHQFNLRRGSAAARSEEDFMPTAAHGTSDGPALRDKLSRVFGAPEVG